MTTMTLQKRLNTGMPGFRPAPAVQSRVSGAGRTRPSPGKVMALDRASLLCIQDGRGTRVRVVSGVLWVTEENSSEDHVLRLGDAIDLARTGTAILSAHLPARIVIEVPPGTPPPRAVEMALANGERRRIARAMPTPMSRSTISSGIATVCGTALAWMRTMLQRLGSRRDAAAANTAKTQVSMPNADGYLPRGLRRRTIRGACKVKRAVIDDWMMWRM